MLYSTIKVVGPNLPQVSPITSPATSTSTGSPIPPTNASSKNLSIVPAIVGGAIGGLAILLLLIAIAYILKRRQKDARPQRRLTFHRDLMVQHRRPPSDIERGSVESVSPILPRLDFQNPITAPTPRGPTRPYFPASDMVMPIPDTTSTHRQVQLDNRVRQLEQQMAGMRRQNRGGTGTGTALEQMRVQAQWLRALRDSPWALGHTDVPPPQLHLYMD
ncbi:hypothetical protein D9615_008326 [Tricholomella constricta]|uniref:Uncharacterized protein n=1 Tax=Tricholomella constricta TaxID=117010 RepID=A0A8H5HDK5_9AGAR|nr:hypothetical protein D9615_008326 [Tricholomella constricta]